MLTRFQWIHNPKDIKYVVRYSTKGTSYNGQAFKTGAGVQAFETYKAASEKGLVVVGGEGQVMMPRNVFYSLWKANHIRPLA
jgi:hypothetical protein